MTRRHEFEASARSSAGRQVLWPLVGEAARWRDWSWMTRTELLRRGAIPPPTAWGPCAASALGPGGSQEEVVVWDPPGHLGYVAVRGLPVRLYRADVLLTDADAGGGTVVTWRCVVEPLVPGTGRMLRFVLRRMVRGFARSVCRYADRQAGAG